jgi:MFS family permease
VAVVLWRLPVPGRGASVDAQPEEGGTKPEGLGTLARAMVGPIVLDGAASFVVGGVGVLTVVLAVEVLDAGEAGTGFLQAATGVGGVVAGIAGGALLARRLEVPLVIGGAVSAVGLVALGLSGTLPLAMVAIAVAVAGLLLLDIVNTTMIQRMIPGERLGRAMGLLQATSATIYSIGSLVVPIAAAAIGVPWLLSGSALLVVGGVVAALWLQGAREAPAPVDPVRLRLLDQPIFAGLPAGRIEAAARRLVPVAVSAGDVIVREGEPADRFYLIDAGTARVTQRRQESEVTLRELDAGAVFGEIGLLRNVPRTATVTATSDGVLYALDADAFADLVGSGPGLSSRLLDLYRGALAR